MIAILMTLMEFVPVVNVVQELVSSADPVWWKFGAKIVETTVVLQMLMPYLEKFTRSTANTWDDGIVAKLKVALAFTLEIIGAIGAIDPKIGKRIAAITGERVD